MTEREKAIARMALIYLQANLSDAIEAFSDCDDDGEPFININVNGDVMPAPRTRAWADCGGPSAVGPYRGGRETIPDRYRGRVGSPGQWRTHR